jgi:molybdopterin-guanine dinucleotide biosynthesis protein A
MIDFDAVVLAGGRGSRLGGVRKPELAVDGRRLVDRALAAVSGARRVIVVGDAEVPEGVPHTREDPPYGGPVEALAAGLAFLAGGAPGTVPGVSASAAVVRWTLVLASDLPEVEAAVVRLLAEDPRDEDDGVCLTGEDGRLQWLLGYYRTEALLARLADRGDPPLTAMHRLLAPLRLRGIAVEPGLTADIDTPDDASHWGVDLPPSPVATDPR